MCMQPDLADHLPEAYCKGNSYLLTGAMFIQLAITNSQTARDFEVIGI